MATDIGLIVKNLREFYSFTDKSVIHVGAGGGQLIGYATDVRKVTAVDSDSTAVERLRDAIASRGWEDRFSVVHGEFGPAIGKADVVLFEFCLHEMTQPESALETARSLAPEVLIIDHEPKSRWAWHTAETEKATYSWAAVERNRLRADQRFVASQHFKNVDELVQRINSLGEPAVSRARQLSDQSPIEIEMGYRIALI